jgi:RNA polymerase sigma factor (sigma-70 family)
MSRQQPENAFDRRDPEGYDQPVSTDSPSVRDRFRRMWPHWWRLFRFGTSRGLGSHDAEDLASETILRTAASRSFNDLLDPWPYLVRTLMNLMADRYRRSLQESQALHRAVEIPDQRRPEDHAVERATAVRELRRLSALESPATVRLIIDHIYIGLTWDELGSRHGISSTAARKRVHRALARLRARRAGSERS